MSDGDRIARLERRLARERAARREAEQIAESGLRELYAANESLDARIRERTRELEEATRRAEAASEARGRFLAHISHEMRTPLNGLLGMLELAGDAVTGGPAESWIESARVSAAHLDRLVERTLRVVELESSAEPTELAPIVVEDIVDAAGDRWQAPCARAGQLLSVEIDTADGTTVAATADVAVALDELLGNVVEHADAGLVVLAATAVGDAVRISVTDSGPGIEAVADGPSEVLDPGAAPTTRRSGGAGVGLALVDRIATSFGATSGHEITEEGGTEAWIELPATGPASDGQPDATPSR